MLLLLYNQYGTILFILYVYFLKSTFFMYGIILMNPIQRVWRIIDLVKLICSFKRDFEHNTDIQKLNNTYLFQHLIPHIFFLKCDSGVVKYNNQNRDRIRIEVCKCDPNITTIQVELFETRKRTPYYFDILFLDNDKEPIANQRKLSEWILNDSLLLELFRSDDEIV